MLALLLFLHIGGAVLAFGPTFTFPILGPMAGARAAARQLRPALPDSELPARLIVPLALFQGVTGLLLVWKIGFDLFATRLAAAGHRALPDRAGPRLLCWPADTQQLIEPLRHRRQRRGRGRRHPRARRRTSPRCVKRGRQAGMIQAVLIVVIVFLMVTKPF